MALEYTNIDKMQNWNEFVRQFDKGGDFTPLRYHKNQGTMRIRLVPDEHGGFVTPCKRVMKGKERMTFLLRVAVMEADGEVENNKVQVMSLPITAFRQMAALLDDADYDFLSPDKGHGFKVDRQGEGMKTRYTVQPSAKPIDLTGIDVVDDLKPLSQIAEEVTANDLRFEAKRAGQQEETLEQVPEQGDW
jgi:hypothetical protein